MFNTIDGSFSQLIDDFYVGDVLSLKVKTYLTTAVRSCRREWIAGYKDRKIMTHAKDVHVAF